MPRPKRPQPKLLSEKRKTFLLARLQSSRPVVGTAEEWRQIAQIEYALAWDMERKYNKLVPVVNAMLAGQEIVKSAMGELRGAFGVEPEALAKLLTRNVPQGKVGEG